ncbi:hypothetical protein EYF80_000084 [Liparis tanakae]|uniref:Uncharacterized protein n=1 Tax=Liparis tanakae TaxID=230148 RepID=A0A4Z2JHT8_9TELE|nr:hypothetical protein EYF80_000084 [Liparis tanakae]
MVMRACVAVGTLRSFRLKVRSPSELELSWGLLESRDPDWELANRNVIRFLVLMESGLGSTLELSAFSTMCSRSTVVPSHLLSADTFLGDFFLSLGSERSCSKPLLSRSCRMAMLASCSASLKVSMMLRKTEKTCSWRRVLTLIASGSRRVALFSSWLTELGAGLLELVRVVVLSDVVVLVRLRNDALGRDDIGYYLISERKYDELLGSARPAMWKSNTRFRAHNPSLAAQASGSLVEDEHSEQPAVGLFSRLRRDDRVGVLKRNDDSSTLSSFSFFSAHSPAVALPHAI